MQGKTKNRYISKKSRFFDPRVPLTAASEGCVCHLCPSATQGLAISRGCCVGAWMGLKVVLKAVAGSEKFMEKKNVGEMNALGWHCCWESLQRPLSCCKHSVAGEIDKNQVQYKDRSQLGLQATCTLVVAAQIWKFASPFDVVAEINRVWHNVSSLYSVEIWKGDTLLAISKGSNDYRNLDGNIFVSEIFRCDTSLSLALSLQRRPA